MNSEKVYKEITHIDTLQTHTTQWVDYIHTLGVIAGGNKVATGKK